MSAIQPNILNKVSFRSRLFNMLLALLPSPGNIVFTLVVVTALFWAQSAHALPWASAPTAAASTAVWPYQGRLSSSTGTPITAALPMTFRLYNVASSGTALWQEQWTSVQVTGGLFNVALGSQTAIPQSIVSNSSLWLGITVGTDAEMTPRVQLGSAPFAWTVPDGSITAAKLANGSITYSKLDPNIKIIPTVFSAVGSDVTYSPPADIFSLPFSVSKLSNMMVIVNIRALSNETGDEFIFNIKRDGIAVTDDTHVQAKTFGHQFFSYSFIDMNVPAGAHQYTIAIHMAAGSNNQRMAHTPSIQTYALP